jgi:GntR family transcriptional regulator/MocR family aminotransferase
LRRELSERRSLVVDALQSAGLPVIGDDAGAHVVVPLDSARAERDVRLGAEEIGVRVDGLARHHAGRARWHGIALGYAACSREELVGVLAQLVDLLRQANGDR